MSFTNFKRVFSFSKANTNPPGLSFQVMSDLHLELMKPYLDFEIPKRAPYLILAGDVGKFTQYEEFESFLRHQCSKFDRVFLVLGNHEFYGTSRDAGLEDARRLEETLGSKLTVLNRTAVEIEDVLILGCTLQSYIPEHARDIVQMKLSDFRVIDGWTIDHHNEEHRKDVQWLKESIKTNKTSVKNRKILVATHHAPSYDQTSAPQHRNNPWSSAFCTDLLGGEVDTWEGLENVKTWLFGHTHWCADFNIGKIRVVSNQRGYVFGTQAAPASAVSKPRFRFKTNEKRRPSTFDVTKTVEIH